MKKVTQLYARKRPFAIAKPHNTSFVYLHRIVDLSQLGNHKYVDSIKAHTNPDYAYGQNSMLIRG